MRKIYFLAFLLLLAFTTRAQITLTSADVGTVGSKYFMNVDTNGGAGIVVGSGGTNMAWDFTSLTPGLSDTIEFLDPASTPYGGDFPSSNLCIFQADLNGYAYLNSTSSELEIIGFAGDPANLGQTFVLPQLDPLKVATFPFTYQDSFQDTSIVEGTFEFNAFPPADSARLRSTAYRTLTADAWGTLEFPGATYNVLRVKEVATTNDQIFVHVPFIGWNQFSDTTYTDSTFTYWANSLGYLLCEIAYEGGSISRVTYQNPNQVSVSSGQLHEHVVYPIPAENTLHIKQRDPRPLLIEIHTLQGQLVKTKRQDGRNLEIDIADLPEGNYVVRLLDKEGKPRHSQIFSVDR